MNIAILGSAGQIGAYLEAYLKEISQGEFYVVHKSKNSPGHDSDKLGLEIRKSK